jgi:hypothetical protein
MADDGEWHTVTSSKSSAPVQTATPSPAPATSSGQSAASKSRRKFRHRITTPKQTSGTTSKQHKHSPSSNKEKSTTTANPFHHHEEEDSADEEEDDGQVDPIDLPVPPYHTSIITSCPLEDCESPIPFLDTTSLVKHLRSDHKLAFKNLHYMYMALDAYLSRWAKELSKKSITEYGQLDEEVYVIDPEKCNLDKEIREDMQRAKLVSWCFCLVNNA